MNTINLDDYCAEQEKLASELSVTMDEYKEAVTQLLEFAQGDTGAAEPAAKVLLSLYNSHKFHIDLLCLSSFDHANLTAALVAIKGRLTLMEEPHNAIPEGEKIFRALSVQWGHLSTSKQYAKLY